MNKQNIIHLTLDNISLVYTYYPSTFINIPYGVKQAWTWGIKMSR
jgi:hypothetical protein